MKKLVLSAFAVCAFTFVSAQEVTTNAGTFSKPQAGAILGEVNFTPDFTGGNLFKLSDSGFGTVGLKARKFVSDTKAYRAMANFEYVDTGVSGSDPAYSLLAGLGIEHHLTGAERLSTYWGYEAKVMFAKDAMKTTSFGVGAAALAGFDYYIIPNVYLGLEVAYGLNVINTKPDAGDGVTGFQLKPSMSPTFRLGWKF
ncbi:MAG TPA: hypothetical protein VLZ11_02540 [Flavobacterium sp.]|nr:hypothetical protein [Flavobacterium sp.]